MVKKERYIFSVFAILAFANGIAYLFFSKQSIFLLGGEETGIGILMTRYYGAIALGTSIAIWLVRNSDDNRIKNALLLGIFISMLVSAVVGIHSSINGMFDNFDWLFIVIDTSLVIWSGFLLYIRSKSG